MRDIPEAQNENCTSRSALEYRSEKVLLRGKKTEWNEMMKPEKKNIKK